MILIVGGTCQGKAAFARSLAGEKGRGNMADDTADGMTDNTADGMTDGRQAALEKTCLLNFHGFVRQAMEDGLDPDSYTGDVLRANPEIVTLDEVGCGIVPAERTGRDYREAVGRAGQLLAAEASEVYRMVCGLPVCIKKDLNKTDDGALG